jgi:hypothetical protein
VEIACALVKSQEASDYDANARKAKYFEEERDPILVENIGDCIENEIISNTNSISL